MYLQNEMLLASPFVLYACLRVRSLIGPRRLKNLWTAAFLVIAVAYPAAETLSHGRKTAWSEAVVLAGYYALPLLLYIVMAVAAVDLAAGLLRLSGVASREAMRSRRSRNWRLAVSLAVPVLVVALGAVNFRVLRVKDYRIEVPRRSAPPRELVVVFMADLHFRDLTSDRLLKELAAKVNARRPDLILIGGDVLEGDRQDQDTGRFERALRGLVSTYGTYGVPGNHERYNRAGEKGFFDRAGVRLLRDEAVTIDDALTLAGRDDSGSGVRASAARLLAGARRDLPVVLLAHRPNGFDKARAAGVDLQLSGHTHAGQIFPVDVLTRRQFDLNWGRLDRGGAHLIVTSGVQGWGPPVRTAGASEIVVIRLILR
ncbi:MAG: metallophosphoesterase [Acidobacteriota bacterium]